MEHRPLYLSLDVEASTTSAWFIVTDLMLPRPGKGIALWTGYRSVVVVVEDKYCFVALVGGGKDIAHRTAHD